MISYIIKRLLLMIPTLLGISIVVFLIIRIAPGNPVILEARGEGGQVDVKLTQDQDLIKLRERMYGLDKPIPVQYIQWLSRIVRLDFGKSMTEDRPVLEMVGERLPLTLTINLIAASLSYLISIPLGLVAARNRLRGGLRRAVLDTGSGVVLLVLYSLPTIFVATLLIAYVSEGGVLADWIEVDQPDWSWLIMPIGGLHSTQSSEWSWPVWVLDMGWHIILPVVTVTAVSLAFMAKLARTSLLENLQADYVRTARAKGLRERTVVYVHALRNSLIPMITSMALILPGLIGGSIIIETIFNLPGMGKLMYDSVMRRDYEMIQAMSMIGAILTLVSLLLADLLYATVDPRVRYE